MAERATHWVRITIAAFLGLLAAAFFGATALYRYESGPSATVAILDHRSCQRCHEEAWREWETSMHARAWRDQTMQASFGTFGFDRKCQSCHAAEPTLLNPEDEPTLRLADLESGVNCVTCHALPDGRIAARRTVADAPCRPVESALLVSSTSCGACHVSSLKDWSQSAFATQGKECHACHMPALAGPGGRRSHAFLGGHDDATVRSGVQMASERDAEELLVRLTNHATGHNFPGERHHRMLVLQVIERASDGQILLSQQEKIKGVTPFRGEASADKIRSGQTIEVRFPVIEDAATADVSLIYKLYPWYTDAEALVVSQQRVELERE